MWLETNTHKYACTNSPKAVKGEGGKWRGKVERGKKWKKWRGGSKKREGELAHSVCNASCSACALLILTTVLAGQWPHPPVSPVETEAQKAWSDR